MHLFEEIVSSHTERELMVGGSQESISNGVNEEHLHVQYSTQTAKNQSD
jgi:hypothetical protein